MAVTTTVQDILDGAYAKSTQNQPNTIATGAVELEQVVTRYLRGLYSFATRINPIHYSATAAVVGASSVWARPENAESIFRIETAGGVEVVVVPYDGNFIADPGQTGAPGAADTLTFWFSKRPIDPTPAGLTGVLDIDWDEAYNELLMLEVAIYLAQKDGRLEEVQSLKVDRNSWAGLFGAYLQHSTSNLRRRYGHRRIVNVETLLPMLAGGA